MKRKKWRHISMSLIVLVLVMCSAVGIRILYLSKATAGEKIPSGNVSKSVLLVLDLQNDTLNIKAYTQTQELMKNINLAVDYASQNNMDIVYTKQEFSNPIDKILAGGLYAPNSNGSKLSPQLHISSSDIFIKERTDAFSNTKFDTYLQDNEVTTLYLVGADASACVYKTALGGVGRGYKVVVLEDCIFSFNKKQLPNMIKKYNSNGIEVDSLGNFIK